MIKNLPAMRDTWVQSLGWEDPLEESMATHASILAWIIPRTEAPMGCSPWGRKELDTTERLSTAQQSRRVPFSPHPSQHLSFAGHVGAEEKHPKNSGTGAQRCGSGQCQGQEGGWWEEARTEARLQPFSSLGHLNHKSRKQSHSVQLLTYYYSLMVFQDYFHKPLPILPSRRQASVCRVKSVLQSESVQGAAPGRQKQFLFKSGPKQEKPSFCGPP